MICFLCGSIAPGRDGVGDYTAALAAELTRQGHACAVVSLMEHEDIPADYPFTHLRLKATQSWEEKARLLKPWLEREQPDVLSLQYVPWTFSPRGLPFGLTAWLQDIAGPARFHVMFHELWVAAECGASFKNCILGVIQKRLIAGMLKKLSPVCVHTTNLVYQELLRRVGWQAKLLPLFSNITPAESPTEATALFESIGLPGDKTARRDWLIAVLFGTVHPTWDPTRAVELLEDAALLAAKRPALLFVGRSGAHGDALRERLSAEHPGLTAAPTGLLDIPALTGVLHAADFAFSASPWALAGKSSAGMTLLGHGLPLIFTDDRWRLRQGDTPLPDNLNGCYLDGPQLAQRISEGLPPPQSVFTLEAAARQLYHDLDTVLNAS